MVRFSAIDGERLEPPADWQGTAGAYGRLQSNLAVVRDARDRGWPSVLVFEDDVVFDDELDAKLPTFMAQVPNDWDMVFFGAMHRGGPVRVREHVLKLTASTSTYAYAVRSTIYPAFLETHAASREPIDVRNRLLQERFNCYCFFPHLAWVDGGLSDTQGRVVHPWWLRDSLILGGAAIDTLQARTLVVIPHEDGPWPELSRRNLAYTVQAYRRLLNRASIVVVEQRHGSTHAPSLGPPDCFHLSIDGDGPLDQGRCYNEAIDRMGRDHDFYVCADRDLVPTWDVRAHLLKCVEHDVASSPRDILTLTHEDSTRLVDGQPIAVPRGIAWPRRGLYSDGCIVTRAAVLKGARWEGAGPDTGAVPSLRATAALSLFDSPALGLRLFSGRASAGAGCAGLAAADAHGSIRRAHA